MNALVFKTKLGPIERVVLAAAGLGCFWPTYDLLIKPGVSVLQLGMVPMWILSLLAMALGVGLLAGAVLGLLHVLIVNPRTGYLVELGAGSFGIRWRKRYAFRDLGPPIVVRDDSS